MRNKYEEMRGKRCYHPTSGMWFLSKRTEAGIATPTQSATQITQWESSISLQLKWPLFRERNTRDNEPSRRVEEPTPTVARARQNRLIKFSIESIIRKGIASSFFDCAFSNTQNNNV